MAIDQDADAEFGQILHVISTEERRRQLFGIHLANLKKEVNQGISIIKLLLSDFIG